MKSRMKKILGFLTVLCLAAGILPLWAVPAFADTAAGTGKAMQQISADNPSGGIADGDHIYMALGAGVPDKTRRRAQHNPEIVFNEKILPAGVAAYTKIAADYLTGRSRKN